MARLCCTIRFLERPKYMEISIVDEAAKVTLRALAHFPSQLEELFGAFPLEARGWSPPSWAGIPSEHFTALEQICHIRDIEIDGYQKRFELTRAGSTPLLPSINSETLAIERDYAHANPDDALAAFRQARSDTVTLLHELDDDDFKLKAEFEGYGQVTLKGLIHYLASHDQQHLAGLQWLLGRYTAF